MVIWMFSEKRYREYLSDKKLNSKTIDAYTYDVRNFCDATAQAGITRLDSVDKENIEKYCASLLEDGMSVVSVRRKLASLKKLFEHLLHIGQAGYNPVEGIRLPPHKKPEPRILTRAEIDKLLTRPEKQTPRAIRDCAMFELMISTGIKVSELINLQKESVISDSRKLLLVRNGEVVDLFLDDRVYQCLLDYLTSARGALLTDSSEKALFLNASGRRLSRQGFWKLLKKRAESAGIGNVTPEALRRSFAFHFADAGNDIHCLNKVLGHSSIAITRAYVKTAQVED